MRERTICILDNNEKYVVRLVDFINEYKAIPFKVFAFTAVDALVDFSDKYEIEMLIMSDNFKTEMENRISCGKVLYLVQHQEVADNEIFRYQMTDYLVKDILAHLEGGASIKSETGKIIIVYSPATKCFKTSLSLVTAMTLGRKGKTLFLSFENYAGLGNILDNSRGGLSKALYYFGIGREKAKLGMDMGVIEKEFGKVFACISKIKNFDYLAPVECPDDVMDFSQKELAEFCKEIKMLGGYEYLVVDAGDCFVRPWELFEIADEIYIPSPMDVIGQRKNRLFLDYLKGSSKCVFERKIILKNITYFDTLAGYDFSLEQLENSISGYVR